ncbi:hypothetical protein MCOR12_008873 [Pyricularia oryzae]|nr:hypothetical protein MCOR12_008873 [Pyricularia oryzae]
MPSAGRAASSTQNSTGGIWKPCRRRTRIGSVGETGSPARPMLDSAQVVDAGGSEPQRHKTHELPHEERPHEMRGVEVPVEMSAGDVQRQQLGELSGSPIRKQ